MAAWCKELNHWKRSLCWERWEAEGEGDDGEWDGWMASQALWIWIWIGSRSWWWTGKPGVLQSMGSQREVHNWATELNWNTIRFYPPFKVSLFWVEDILILYAWDHLSPLYENASVSALHPLSSVRHLQLSFNV